MERNDILGDDGRTAIHAVVKVSTFNTWKYTRDEVEKRLRGCFIDPQVNLISSVLPDRQNTGKQSYDIGDIHKALSTLLKMEGSTETCRTVSKEDEKEINKARRHIETEYQKSLSFHCVEKVSLQKGYESINETFPFSEANEEPEVSKLELVEEIFGREVVNTFSSESSEHKIPPVFQDTVCYYEDDGSSDDEENRIYGIKSVDPEAWMDDGHGSGFIVGDNLIITAKHVVEGAKGIRISNAVIGE